MEIKKQIKKTLCNTCVLFTAIIIIYALVVMLINIDAQSIQLDGARTVLFFFFSLMISVANSIFSTKSIAAALRLTLHFVICAFAFYLCLMLPIEPTPANTVIGMAFFTVIYFVVAAIVYFFRSRYKKLSEENETYTKRFSK